MTEKHEQNYMIKLVNEFRNVLEKFMQILIMCNEFVRMKIIASTNASRLITCYRHQML
jgi:hypothetical protein